MQVIDVMKRTGLSRKAIYVYEKKGLLTPNKVPMGEWSEYRSYTEEDVQRLQCIAKLRSMDVSLDDIQKLLDGENANIVLQQHLKKSQEAITELISKTECVSKLLVSISPNADLSELADQLKAIHFETDCGERLVDDVIRQGEARRLSMLMFEAFIDKPMDSEERWNEWYTLLETVEDCCTDDMIDAYEEFYGSLTTEQLCEDYILRRKLVTGYTTFDTQDEQNRASEIFNELRELLLNEKRFIEWHAFYKRIAEPDVLPEGTSQCVQQLSDVYESYQEHFQNMLQLFLLPKLEQDDGKLIKELIRNKMEGRDMFNYRGLIYFDFYNRTLSKVRNP